MLNFLLIAWIAPCFWDKNVGVGLVTPLTNRRCDPEHAKLWEISGRRILSDGNTYVAARTVGSDMDVRSQSGLGLNGVRVL